MAYFNFDDPNKRYEEAANQINLPKSILEAYQERRLQTEQLRQDQARTSLANYTQQLRAGDYSALTSIAAINPQAAQEARLGLERRDNVSANIASQFLRTDISRKPERYQESLAQLASMGVDVSKFPNTYSPDRAEEAMRWFVDQSKSNTDLLKEQGEQLKNRELEAKIRNEAIMARKHEQEILTSHALQGKYESEATKLRKQAQATGDNDPILARQVDKDTIIEARAAATSAKITLRTLGQLNNILDKSKTGKYRAFGASVAQYVPIKSNNTVNYQTAESLSKKLAVDIAKQLKPVSNVDIIFSANQIPSFDKLPEANKQISANIEAVEKLSGDIPQFISKWRAENGSTINTDKDGRTYDEVKSEWELKRFEELGGSLDVDKSLPGSNSQAESSPQEPEAINPKTGQKAFFRGGKWQIL
jgi:hypothetical protein